MTDELDEVLTLLCRDLANTLPARGSRDLVGDAALAVEQLDTSQPAEWVVNHIQQLLHDTFADTSWPVCPLHGQHPLWFRDGAWWCERDEVRVAALGALPAPGRKE